LFRTKNNPDTILLIKEEAMEAGCGISLSEITENRLDKYFSRKI